MWGAHAHRRRLDLTADVGCARAQEETARERKSMVEGEAEDAHSRAELGLWEGSRVGGMRRGGGSGAAWLMCTAEAGLGVERAHQLESSLGAIDAILLGGGVIIGQYASFRNPMHANHHRPVRIF
ncbi:hypothetical protein CYMTET_21367 [Cymbomonas tetramitiformis]|uniref:Uncharacterized protein n=1 Tax=Cymbomonas tetramitiformis TaxID=36881 RepID=A0AAE0G2Y7_9CHLO|nr:hypothetical protein CYMTET_21367 [Cymbomonas tetramitiformis]